MKIAPKATYTDNDNSFTIMGSWNVIIEKVDDKQLVEKL